MTISPKERFEQNQKKVLSVINSNQGIIIRKISKECNLNRKSVLQHILHLQLKGEIEERTYGVTRVLFPKPKKEKK